MFNDVLQSKSLLESKENVKENSIRDYSLTISSSIMFSRRNSYFEVNKTVGYKYNNDYSFAMTGVAE